MSCPDRPVPKSYDDIVRATVPDLDSSRRPSTGQEQQAREGFRALDEDEAALQEVVAAALADDPEVEAEVTRTTVTLRGRVRDTAAITRIEDRVREIEGVDRVVSQLVVAA